MTTTIRALLIDPIAQSVTEIELPRDSDGDTSLSAMYAQLQCRHVDKVTIGRARDSGNEIDLWVDDEGRFQYPNPLGYFAFKHAGTDDLASDVFCGRGLILDANPRTGRTVAASLLVHEVTARLVFLPNVPELAVEPVCYVTGWED